MGPIRLARLVLREMEESDLEAIHAYASDPVGTRFMHWGPGTIESTRAFLRHCIEAAHQSPRKEYELAVALHSGEMIGACGLRVGSERLRHGFVGYILHPDHWGKGYATEAAGGILAFGFAELGLHRISAECDVANTASARVLEKIGMRMEGRLRDHDLCHGEWRDSYVYAILEQEWRARSKKGS